VSGEDTLRCQCLQEFVLRGFPCGGRPHEHLAWERTVFRRRLPKASLSSPGDSVEQGVMRPDLVTSWMDRLGETDPVGMRIGGWCCRRRVGLLLLL
jgi:hypothetical protein